MAHSTDTLRRALVTGIGGQDGSYLAELLLDRGYEIHGTVARDPDGEHRNLAGVRDRVELTATDLTDPAAVGELIAGIGPDEVYNLAAPSVVGASWNDPPATIAMMTGSVTCLLEAIVAHAPQARYFQATSSEIFRGSDESPQNESTTPRPTSPYGVGKLAGHALVHAYRERHGLHASSGILYNHESPRRPVDFVPSKIVDGAVKIKLGRQDRLLLGDRSARRDWGYAVDFVEAIWTMLQQPQPGDYVIATGKTHSVDDLVRAAFGAVDLDPDRYVDSDQALMRSGDEAQLVGDPSRIAEATGWRATTGFDELIGLMVEARLREAETHEPQR